ncbi:MAG: FadR/GntR family transcriptional regulator [Lachnospiraceae bacterium]|nr:FadR/GntR family transcriptional regulator [Lachnospiraceae bacterium]
MDINLLDNVKESGQPLAGQVAERISQLIIDQHLTVNDKLPNEFELAKQLNVGRGTIREAIKQLAAKNVVVIKRGLGTFVTKEPGVVKDPFGFAFISDSNKLASDLLETRLLIEPWAAGLAAEYATDQDILRLRKANSIINEKIRKKEDYGEADEQFHVIISSCTQNLVLPKIIPVIVFSIHQLMPINSSLESFNLIQKNTMETHREIVEAIAAHDSQAAKEAMYRHLSINLDGVHKKSDLS